MHEKSVKRQITCDAILGENEEPQAGEATELRRDLLDGVVIEAKFSEVGEACYLVWNHL